MAGVAPQKSGPAPQELELPGSKSGFRNWLDRNAWRDIIIATPYAWLILFFVAPFFIIVAMSLAESVIAQPPFKFADVWPYVTFDNFERLFSDRVYLRGYFTSVRNAAIAAGYVAAFSVQPGFNRPGLDPYRVRRLDVWGTDTPAMLLRKMNLGTNDGTFANAVRYAATRTAARLGLGAR